jgi:hypothetical protein
MTRVWVVRANDNISASFVRPCSMMMSAVASGEENGVIAWFSTRMTILHGAANAASLERQYTIENAFMDDGNGIYSKGATEGRPGIKDNSLTFSTRNF